MKRKFFGHWLLNFITLLLICFYSCERDGFRETKPGNFFFSTDTVMFDTIFTDTGTSTYKLLIHNPNDYSIRFDSVFLANRADGFIVNINGITQLPLKDVTLEPNDSLYIFVQAFIPSGQQSEAFILEDSLVVVSGKLSRNVKLIAFGQNAVSFRDEHIQSQEWYGTKPYLIFGTLTVDSASTLKIREGVRVYFHRNARLLIKGNILVSGTYSHPVRFLNDRPEKDYDSIPGQWGGIVVSGKEGKHFFNYAIIRNAITGIQLGEPAGENPVKADIYNTFIANMSYSAITAYASDLTAQNCVFANAGNSACSLIGGKYSFLHCTFANYGPRYIMRAFGSKTLVIRNYAEDSPSAGVQHIRPLEKTYFGNSVVYGNSSEEIELKNQNGYSFNYVFENCLLKTSLSSISGDNITGKSPVFMDPENENFRLDSLSFARDAGKITIGNLVPVDLDNHSRTSDQAPDAGAYEKEETK